MLQIDFTLTFPSVHSVFGLCQLCVMKSGRTTAVLSVMIPGHVKNNLQQHNYVISTLFRFHHFEFNETSGIKIH